MTFDPYARVCSDMWLQVTDCAHSPCKHERSQGLGQGSVLTNPRTYVYSERLQPPGECLTPVVNDARPRPPSLPQCVRSPLFLPPTPPPAPRI